MIPSIFTDKVNISRRQDISVASRDQLNNPVYGEPITGAGWTTVYSNILVRIQFSGKDIKYAPTGEMVKPVATLYYSKDYDIRPMDRLVTVSTPGYPANIEYIIEVVYPSFILNGSVDHFEGKIALPVS